MSLKRELSTLKDSLKREENKKHEISYVDSIIKKNKLLATSYGDFIDWHKKTNKYQKDFSRYQELYFFNQFLDSNLIGDNGKSQIELFEDLVIYNSEKSK